MSTRRQLDGEGSLRIVTAVDGDTSPTIAVRSTVLELVIESQYLHEALIGVFILSRGVSKWVEPDYQLH